MRDYINIGSAPANESCAQVGDINYPEQSRKECQALISQLRRELGEEPEGAQLSVKSFQHDFGSYHEVVCYYDDQNEETVNYAFKCESELPYSWDEKAKEELK